jgi:hypothetical protein
MMVRVVWKVRIVAVVATMVAVVVAWMVVATMVAVVDAVVPVSSLVVW